MKEWVQAQWQMLKQILLPKGANDRHCTQAYYGPPKGKRAEKLAEAFLSRQGVKILARNVSCRAGELDLIGYHKHTVLFIEVRLRSRNDYGGAAQSITPGKQKRIIKTAQYWLVGTGKTYANKTCRFDAVLLDQLDAKCIEWVQDAFTL